MKNLDPAGRDLNSWPWNVWQLPNSGVTQNQLAVLDETAAEALAVTVVMSQTEKITKSGGTAQVLVPRKRNGHGVIFHHSAYASVIEDSQYVINSSNFSTRVWAGLLAAGYVVVTDPFSTTAQWANAAMGERIDAAWDFGKKFVAGKWVHVAVSKGAFSALMTLTPNGPAGHDHFGEGAYLIAPGTDLAWVYLVNPLGATAEMNTAYNIPGGGTYAAQTAGRDPNLLAANSWSGKRLRAAVSSGDTLILRANNWDSLAANKMTGAVEASTFEVTGEHAALNQFNVDDMVSFCGRCVSPTV